MKKLKTFSFKAFELFFGLFPLWGLNAIGDFLAFLWIDVLRIRRQVIADNLRLAFPEITESEINRIRKSSMQALTRSSMHLFEIPKVNDRWIQKHVDFEGRHYLEDVLSRGHGALLLSMHLGSGDLAVAAMSHMGLPVTLISKKFKSQWLNDFWFYIRSKPGTQFIDPHSAQNAFQIFAGLKQNRGIIFVSDQFMGKPYGVETSFFGQKTGSPYGLAVFAAKTKAPVLPIYTYWETSHKLKIVFEAPMDLELDKSATKAELSVNTTQKFNDKIEQIVRKFPQHWMWVHKRWKVFE